ncbi:ABC transporter permease [Streptomyces sp. NBC_01361]|uniref:ABC transporter permease n=1 Tax=Streptomyces sp. NBC_01361 TaxID=2903838 RepID=UPI002E343A8A|nr:ABC transporter permease [Streptomyces sp. NBC_01361]
MTTAIVPDAQAGPSSTAPGAPPTANRRIMGVLLHDRGAMLSAGFIALMVLMAVCAPLISTVTGHGPTSFDTAAIDVDSGGLPKGSFGGVSADHLFGVEPQNGRDLLARIAYGARVSFSIAVSATVLTTLLGVMFGMVAGFYGGWVDQVISRVMDFLMAFPALIFMIAILSSLPTGNKSVLLVAVISFFGWPYLARVVRGQTLTLLGRDFVEAARASGASKRALVFKEILPNLRSSLIVMTTLAVPGYIGTEAGLSFLGVGVSPPTASWGQMISSSVHWYAVDPLYFVIPGLFLFLTVLSLTVLGDRVRAATDAGEAA